MISHKHKFIFTHIPKTGGTSITRALNPNAGIKNKPLKEMPLKDKEDYFKFTFVRNPWDRAVSMFFFRQKRGWLTKKKFEDVFCEPLTFKNWAIKFPLKICFSSTDLCNTDGSYLQSWWMKDKTGKINMDYVGRFENLQEDFNIICAKIGMKQKKLSHQNKTKHKPYVEYYDDQTRKIVAQKCSQDIERFGYKFGE